jgi:replicative DNA helicase
VNPAHVLPHDPEAESCVLGGVMMDAEQLPIASAIVVPDDFFAARHKFTWLAMIELAEEGQPIDPLTLRVKLEAQGRLDEVGAPYLFKLVDGVPRSMNTPAYATRVRELADRRRMILVVRKLEAQAFDQTVPMLELHDMAQRMVLGLAERETARGFTSIGDVIRLQTWPALEEARSTLSRHRGIPGLSTGLDDWDARSGGLQPSEVTVVGACTSVGKSSLATNVVLHIGSDLRLPVAVFSPEMSSHAFTVRALANAARVNTRHLLGGCLTEADWQRVIATMSALSGTPVYLDESTGLTLPELRTRARRLHAECGPLRLVVVDYVQLLHDPTQRAENRNLEIGAISRALRALAKELHVPFLVLAQLNRKATDRGRPQLSDLRDSGALEQDADVVCLLHRPADEPFADLIIAKNRNGPTGTVKLHWVAEQTRFENEVDAASEPQETSMFQ